MFPKRESCIYTAQFCEENVYHLAKYLVDQGLYESIDVLFISNSSKTVVFFHQKRSPEYVVWDYHVVLVAKPFNSSHVYLFDLDTSLDFPTTIQEYITKALQPHLNYPEQFRRCYRLIDSSKYLEYFASDRSHMAESNVPYPVYPPIKTTVFRV
ncbi:N-terminal glutamine amidase-domain-containing protein [Globomyces pollinis-pini]|nr:N-terminal glutamine amidase-domain-containing protein [Globomyces pollinis-pini]